MVQDGNHQSVPFAKITINQSKHSSPLVRQTNEEGKFLFKELPAGKYDINIYAFGFEKETVSVELHNDTLLSFVLKPLHQTLTELTISGKKPTIIRKPDRVIYDLDNSISTEGSNGLETLSKAPGIKVSGNHFALAGKGQVGVMINNRPVHLSGESLIRYLKSLSASQISKIEIITHPSAKYTAEGNAGLINIVTKKSSDGGFSGNIQGSLKRSVFTDPPYYGARNYGYASGSAGLYYDHKKWSAYANMSYRHGRQLEGYGIDVYYPGKHWSMKDTGDFKGRSFSFRGGMDYQLSKKTTIGAGYQFEKTIYIGDDHINAPIYHSNQKVDSFIHSFADYYPVAYSNGINLHLIHDIGAEGAKLTLNADYFNYYRHDRSHFRTDIYTHKGQLLPGSSERYYDTTLQNIKIYTLKADMELPTSFANYAFGGKVSFIDNYSNIYYYDITATPKELIAALSNEYRYKENTQSLYVSGNKEVGKWGLRAGVRAEFTQTKGRSYFKNTQIKNQYLKLFPSFLVAYQSDKQNKLTLSFDKRIHRPTFWNLNPYKSLMTVYSYVEGNPYLRPEYISNIEIAHHFKQLFTTSLYVNIINNGFADITQAHKDSSNIYTTPLNVIKARRYGFSEEVSLHPFPWWENNSQVNVYYTTTHSDFDFIDGIEGMGLYLETNNTVFFNKEKTWSGFIQFWCQFPEVKDMGKSDTYYNLDAGVQTLLLDKRLNLSLTASDILQSSAPVIHSTVNHLRETYTNFQVFSNVRLAVSWNFGNKKIKQKPVETGNKSEKERAD